MSPVVQDNTPLVKDNDLLVDDSRWRIVHLRANEALRSHSSIKQKSPFDSQGKSTAPLDLDFYVEPRDEWEKLSQFARCKVDEQVYRVQQYVFVQPASLHHHSGAQSDGTTKDFAVQDFWVAKILELRATEEARVFARVAAPNNLLILGLTPPQAFWMYWPDDLPLLKDCAAMEIGRRKYHGKHELITSNHMEIIDVCTFAGLASVSAWPENDDDAAQTGLYWRQIFDYRTRQLSKLKKYCTCESYYKPDKIIISCPNLGCSTWLHAECLIDGILNKKCQSRNICKKGVIIEKRKSKLKKGKVLPQAKKLYEEIYSAEIVGGEGEDPPQVEITDLRLDSEHQMKKWKEVIVCPKCDTKIE